MSTPFQDALAADVEQPAPALDLDGLIRDLDAGVSRPPVEALRLCQASAELVTPRLIEVIEEATRLGREGKIREGNAPLFAMLLLTEFRAAQALPAVLDLMSLPEDALDALFGDSITEDFPRVLAVLGADHPDLIEAMIASPALYEWVRWAGGTALCMLVRDGRLKREEAIERLGRQLRTAVAAGDRWTATIAVCELGRLNPLELSDEIKAALDADLIEDAMIDWEDFSQDLLDADRPGQCPELATVRPSVIDDTVEEVTNWNWPGDERPPRPYGPIFGGNLFAGEDNYDQDDEGELDYAPPPLPGALTIRREAPRVGRNDPCPCGSGKKYKKCCQKLGDDSQ